MLILDTPQPSLELVMVLFSPKAQSESGICLLPLQCIVQKAYVCTHAHLQKEDVYLEAVPLTEQPKRGWNTRVEQVCFEAFSSD